MSVHARRATFLLILVLVALGLVAIAKSWGFLATGAPLVISGVIATGTILSLGKHSAPGLPAQTDGDQLVRVRPKCALKRDEWMTILRDADTELYIAGHSLATWCATTNRTRFTSNVARILERGRVTLVILHPESQALARLYDATSKNYAANVRESLRILEQFVEGLRVEDRQNLKIALLEDPLSLPYMVVGNELRLITATYLATGDSEQMPCLELDRESPGGSAIYNDLHRLAERGHKVPV